MALKPRQKSILVWGMCGLSFLGLLVVLLFHEDQQMSPTVIKKLEYRGESVIVLNPRLTAAAYSDMGFYAYYNKKCDKSCLTIPLREGPADSWGTYNKKTIALLKSLNYPIMDDSEIHLELLKNPDYLNQYDTLILLHSEYVTKELYRAITNHRHVIYLAPNALYAEVNYHLMPLPEITHDMWGNEHKQNVLTPVITLVRGHNYPDQSIRNGFGWKYDNSPEEYDVDCTLWNFRDVSNGKQLNCAQEIYSQHNPNILLKMKSFLNVTK